MLDALLLGKASSRNLRWTMSVLISKPRCWVCRRPSWPSHSIPMYLAASISQPCFLVCGSNLVLVINFIYIKYIYYLNKNIFLSLILFKTVINFIHIKYIYYLNKNIFLSLNYLKLVINFIHIKYIYYFKKLKLLFLPYFLLGRHSIKPSFKDCFFFSFLFFFLKKGKL